MGDKNITTYNIINSVKGGCGKSTFAIMLALALDASIRKDLLSKCSDEEAEGIDKKRKPGVCLIDMDLQGTSMAYLLFGKQIDEGKMREITGADIYLNEKVIQTDINEKKYVSHFKWMGSEAHMFDIILSSPKQEDKNRFKSSGSLNYSLEVPYSRFRVGFWNMLKESLKTQNEYMHQHIIFDLPPNWDGYSDTVFDCTLKEDTVLESQDICNIFFVQTQDKSQRYSTTEYFRDFIKGKENTKASRIFFVYNNIFFNDPHEVQTHMENAVSEMKNEIEKMATISEELINKIFFVGIRFNPEYYALCCTRDGIKNVPMVRGRDAMYGSGTNVKEDNIVKPVVYLADYKGHHSTKETADLIRLINSESVF